MDWSHYYKRITAAIPSGTFSRTHLLFALAIGTATLIIGVWFFLFSAPGHFPTDRLIEIPSDSTVSEIALTLEKEGVIRSSFVFRVWMRLTGADRNVHAGTYYFAEPLGVFSVSHRIAEGNRGIESIRVTLIEGMTVREMAQVLDETLPDFDAALFLTLAKPYEGYLFPDTYFIDPGTSPETVVERMRETFDTRTETLRASTTESHFERAVIMASLIEKEADTAEDRRIVSGILWNRIEIDMPLQVDAVFGYILERSGYAPTGNDLEIDSPYNTYTNRDLPPGPISNPGLDSLIAALTPTETDYIYYLTGKDGLMYYAETFEGHKRNRELYLD